MSAVVYDNYGRRMHYLRLSVTDRCNLRCRYCMPGEGLDLSPREKILTWEEMHRLCRIFTHLGVDKIRITGGEPFVRRGLLHFLQQISGLREDLTLAVTTNGTLLSEKLLPLQSSGVSRLNISLDSLEPGTFRSITRRRSPERPLDTVRQALQMGFRVKINMVVLPGLNDHEIPDFVGLTRDLPLIVRFIEPMPFNGMTWDSEQQVTGWEILRIIRDAYPLTREQDSSEGKSTRYRVPGYPGKIGIIQGYSRSFCGSCSRIRVSADGQLRTCLYAQPGLDLKRMLRDGSGDNKIAEAIREALLNRFEDGFQAEAASRESEQLESMSTIGG